MCVIICVRRTVKVIRLIGDKIAIVSTGYYGSTYGNGVADVRGNRTGRLSLNYTDLYQRTVVDSHARTDTGKIEKPWTACTLTGEKTFE